MCAESRPGCPSRTRRLPSRRRPQSGSTARTTGEKDRRPRDFRGPQGFLFVSQSWVAPSTEENVLHERLKLHLHVIEGGHFLFEFADEIRNARMVERMQIGHLLF